MAITAEDIASGAAQLLGADDVTDLDESGVAGVSRENYDSRIDDLISRHNWRQFRAYGSLSKDAEATPATRWRYAYLFPSDAIGMPVEVFYEASVHAMPRSDFELSGTHVFTNQETVVVGYTKRKPERYWHAPFVMLAKFALASDWAMSITEVEAKADYWHRRAFGLPSDDERGGQFKTAVNADMRNEPQGSVYDTGNPLGDVRFSGGGAR